MSYPWSWYGIINAINAVARRGAGVMVTDGLKGNELIDLPLGILEYLLPELSNRDVKSLSLITNRPSYHLGTAWLNLAHQVEGWEGISENVIRQVKQQAVNRIKEAVTKGEAFRLDALTLFLRLHLLVSSEDRGEILLNVLEKLHRPAARSVLTRNKLAPYYVLKSLKLHLGAPSIDSLDSLDVISPPAGRSIANMLINNDVLTSLDLEKQTFGEQGFRDICEALAHNKTLTSLNLSNTGATAAGAALIAEALRGNGVLKSLDVSFNKLGLKGVSDIISAGKTLTALSISKSVDLADGRRDTSVEPLIDALRGNTSLVDLNLSNIATGRRVQRLIGDVLTQRDVIMERVELNDHWPDTDARLMSFRDNSLNALSIAAILDAPIRSLSLQSNSRRSSSINDEVLTYQSKEAPSAPPWMYPLHNNKVLTDLDLSENFIEDEGARAIGQALRYNSVLTHLNLSYNKIGSYGAESMGEALAENTVMQVLNLSHNHFRPAGKVATRALLEDGRVPRARFWRADSPDCRRPRCEVVVSFNEPLPVLLKLKDHVEENPAPACAIIGILAVAAAVKYYYARRRATPPTHTTPAPTPPIDLLTTPPHQCLN